MILLNGNTILSSKRISRRADHNGKAVLLHSDLHSYAVRQFGELTVPFNGNSLEVKYLGVYNQSGKLPLLSTYFHRPSVQGDLPTLMDYFMHFASESFKNTVVYGATDEGTFFITMVEGAKESTYVFYPKGTPEIHQIFALSKGGKDTPILQLLNQSAGQVENYLLKCWAYFAYQYTGCSLNYDRYDLDTEEEQLDVRPTDTEIEEEVKFISPMAWKGPKTRYYPQSGL